MTAKHVVLAKRADHLALEEFHRRLQAQLVTSATGEGAVARVAYTRTAGGAYRRGEPPFDAAVEITSGPSRADRWPLVGGLLDRRRTVVMDVVDRLVKDGAVPPRAVVSIALVTPRSDLTADDARDHWRDVHGPIAARIPQLLRYVQCHADGPFLGCAFAWFASTDDMRASAATEEYAATRADEPNFLAGPPPTIIGSTDVLVGE